MRRLLPLSILLLVAGCSIFHYHPHPLLPYKDKDCMPANGIDPCDAHASTVVGRSENRDGMFVGIAISGGGFRAANFGAAVLYELNKHGVVEQADFISSNSGGSIAAALLALDGYSDVWWPVRGTWWPFKEDWWPFHPFWSASFPIRFFDKQALKDDLRLNLQLYYTATWFSPLNILAYWFTTYNRTDIMYYAFDSFLFSRATYGDIARLNRDGRRRPKLLINATDKQELQDYRFEHGTSGQRFVFSSEQFAAYEADLSKMPLSVAVTASSSVPGLYNTATLKTPKKNPQGDYEYLHLMDGMLTDDLAVRTLLDVLRKSVKDATFPRNGNQWGKCILISIDASPRFDNRWRYEDETREFYKDYLIDRNLSDMAAYLLLSQRHESLEELGFEEADIDRETFARFTLPGPDGRPGPSCDVWHIALRRIPLTEADDEVTTVAEQCKTYRSQEDYRKPGRPRFTFGERLTWIPTEFDMTTCQQEDLWAAAFKLVQDGWPRAAAWFPPPAQGTPLSPPAPSPPAGRP